MNNQQKWVPFWERYVKVCDEHNEKPFAVLKELKISPGAPVNWKKGVIPNGEILQKISDHFDVSIDYLLSDVEVSIKPCGKLTGSAKTLFRTLSALPQRWESLMRGDIITRDEIATIRRYVNCKESYLEFEHLPFEEDVVPYENERLFDTETLHFILDITDKCADNELYRILQVQLSKIALYHLENDGGITPQMIADSQRIDGRKISFLTTGNKSRDAAFNYGLNYSDLSAIRDEFGKLFEDNFGEKLSYQFMFTGVKKDLVSIIKDVAE